MITPSDAWLPWLVVGIKWSERAGVGRRCLQFVSKKGVPKWLTNGPSQVARIYALSTCFRREVSAATKNRKHVVLIEEVVRAA
ncbi:unnamed protein product [Protopolystoma xenopodis]|uniref:Uncharacterized protein n=1 Tax=Protopolystoma xenopodis TaxID=117903 RepID=A0A448XMZ6_9PLAT|nr:unnamed protein product [Protopolystoma xenopodis]